MFFEFNEYGVVEISEEFTCDVAGGDATVLVPLVGLNLHPYYVGNLACPSATVPGPISGHYNGLCGNTTGYAPAGTNAGCSYNMPGTNPVCVTNAVC